MENMATVRLNTRCWIQCFRPAYSTIVIPFLSKQSSISGSTFFIQTRNTFFLISKSSARMPTDIYLRTCRSNQLLTVLLITDIFERSYSTLRVDFRHNIPTIPTFLALGVLLKLFTVLPNMVRNHLTIFTLVCVAFRTVEPVLCIMLLHGRS